jgi:hypothetical protein
MSGAIRRTAFVTAIDVGPDEPQGDVAVPPSGLDGGRAANSSTGVSAFQDAARRRTRQTTTVFHVEHSPSQSPLNVDTAR